MRISDWSSDVCSSDLRSPIRAEHRKGYRAWTGAMGDAADTKVWAARPMPLPPIGPAAWDARSHPRCAVIEAHRAHRCSFPAGLRAVSSPRFHRAARSEEHTSELQSLMRISYAVFCLKKKKDYTHVST